MNRPSPRDDMFFSAACNRAPHPAVAVVTERFAPIGVGPVAVVLLVGSLLASGCQRGSPGDQATPATTAAAPATAEDQAMEILKKMVAAYQQAGTYADAGKVRSRAVVDGIVQEMDPIPFSVAMTRPNRIRTQMFETVVVSDGKLLHAAAQSLPGQVLEVLTPAKLTDANFPPDPLLAKKMTGETPIFASPQLHLLLADDPLRAFASGVAKATLISEAEAEGHRCHRVRIGDDKNRFVYWIDQETFVVRRVDLPSAPFTENADTNVVPKNVEVWFDLAGAKLGGPIEPAAFQFEVPADSQRLKAFVALPPPRPARIGEPIADFHFTDLDGNQVSRDSLHGKIVLLDFWFTTCPPCKTSMPHLSQLYQRFKGNDRVRFLAVSIDDPKLADEKVVETLQSWGVDLPLVRDLENQGATALKLVGAPTTLLLGVDGVIQTYLVGAQPNYDAVGDAIDRLLAGQDVAAKVLEEYEQKIREYKRRLAEATVVASNQVIEVPNTKIAPASEPTTIGLEKLWRCDAIKQPGNLLIVAADGKTP
ncbi:MAG: redoxin domain-containing protein, partial [Pirellulales bacterium]